MCIYICVWCSREEVESLGAVKKGWLKKKESKPETFVLEKELQSSSGNHMNATAIMSKKLKKPKTSMDFDRDWRRMKCVTDKLRYVLTDVHMLTSSLMFFIYNSYLTSVGIARSCKILRCDMGAELMEDILLTLVSSRGEGEGEEDTSASQETEVPADMGEDTSTRVLDPFPWLKAFSEFDRFSLNLRFLSENSIQRIGTWLREECAHEEAPLIAARYDPNAS